MKPSLRYLLAALMVLALNATAITVSATSSSPAAISVAGCAKPSKTKKVSAKMEYGSGTLGPLGARVLDGDMATADVAIFGDSITERGCGELKTYLAGLGKVLATDAQGSRDVVKTATDIEAYTVLPKRVVLAAGTNNIFNPTVFGAAMDRILAHLEAVGVEHVLWVDIQACRTGSASSPASAAQKVADQRNSMAINMQIHERLPASQIAPWAWNFIANPARLGWYLQDGVHPYAGPTGPNGYDGTANWRAVIMGKLAPLL